MKSKFHVIGGIVACVILCIVYTSNRPFLIVAAMFGATMPDLDIPILGLGSHRNRVFHSCIIPAALFVYCLIEGVTFFSSAFAAGVLSHLALDIKVIASSAVAGRTRRSWIAANALLCIPLLIPW